MNKSLLSPPIMHCLLIKTLVLIVSLAQATTATTFPQFPSESVDALAQKLEDLFNGNANNRITFADCEAAYDELLNWTSDFYEQKVEQGPLRYAIAFLDDFVHDYLEGQRIEEYRQDSGAAEKYVERLENAYRRLHDSYTHNNSIRTYVGAIKARKLVDCLLGTDGPPTMKIYEEGFLEFKDIAEQWVTLPKEANLFERLDEYESLNKFMMSAEALTLMDVVFKPSIDRLLKRDNKTRKVLFEKISRDFRRELSANVNKYGQPEQVSNAGL